MSRAAADPRELYDAALAGCDGAWWIRFPDGDRRPMPVRRWLGPVGEADRRVLDRAAGPVLDVGCGPGRHLRALATHGVEAVGLDVSPAAVALARRGGGRVVHGSIWDDAVTADGGWATVLLLDGNLGIGGRPLALLRRVAELLAADGRVLVEAVEPAAARRGPIRLEGPAGVSRPFAWSFVGAEALPAVALGAGLAVTAAWHCAGRSFAQLEPSAAAAGTAAA